jgi:tetratricopeptide (TPR) repeat protein
MNKYASALALCFTINIAFAQTNAITFAQAGKLDQAKAEIDKALQNPKLSTKAKTWYYRGQIYEAIANDQTKIYSKLDSNAATVAYESYKKASELDKPGGSFDKDSKAALASQSLYAALFNQAIQRYQARNYPAAVAIFRLAQETSPKDTLAALYTGIASQQQKDLVGAKAAFEKYMELGGKEAEVYSSVAGMYLNDKNNDKALELIQKGLALHPTNKALKDQELNLYLTSGKMDQAIENLQKAVAREPNNPQYLLNLGILYDNAGKKEEALGMYKKVLAIQPDNFDANYNLGVFYFNQGADATKKLNKMDLKQYQKDGKKAEAEVQSKFSLALPYFEKAHKINPKDVSLMENLAKVYTQLKRSSDADKMIKAIDAAEKGK